MAKKTKKDNSNNASFGGIIIVLFILLLLLLTPIILLIMRLYYKSLLKNEYSSMSGNESDFWLDENEKQNYVKLYNGVNEAKNKIDEANSYGENNGISRNQDGRFSIRSNLGKKLRALIEEKEEYLATYSNKLKDIVNLPHQRFKKYKEAYVRVNASLNALIAWVVTLTIGVLFSDITFSDVYISMMSILTDEKVSNENITNFWIFVMFYTFLTYAITVFTRGKKFKNIAKEPPLVEPSNYDSF